MHHIEIYGQHITNVHIYTMLREKNEWAQTIPASIPAVSTQESLGDFQPD